MDCCQCQAIEMEFDRETAERKVQQYHERGLKKETKILVDALVAEGVQACSILDVGGGLGALEFALIDAGASRATNVEASSAYITVAKEETSRQGLSEQISHIHGDFVHVAKELPQADLVILDKVVCCYVDMESLVGLSVEKAKKRYGLIYPRDVWWMKVFIGFDNLIRKIKGNDFRLFVHPTQEVDRIIKDQGLKEVFSHNLVDWQIVVYERSSTSLSSG